MCIYIYAGCIGIIYVIILVYGVASKFGYGSAWITCVLVWIGGMDRAVGSGYGSGLYILTRRHMYIYIYYTHMIYTYIYIYILYRLLRYIIYTYGIADLILIYMLKVCPPKGTLSNTVQLCGTDVILEGYILEGSYRHHVDITKLAKWNTKKNTR